MSVRIQWPLMSPFQKKKITPLSIYQINIYPEEGEYHRLQSASSLINCLRFLSHINQILVLTDINATFSQTAEYSPLLFQGYSGTPSNIKLWFIILLEIWQKWGDNIYIFARFCIILYNNKFFI